MNSFTTFGGNVEHYKRNKASFGGRYRAIEYQDSDTVRKRR